MKLFVQKNFENTKAYEDMICDSESISNFIKIKKKQLYLLNKKGVSSKKIQDFVYKGVVKRLGYSYEKKQDFCIPDFIKIKGSFGIIIEVERGKTINNNMDFIDFWKCHINKKANMLILIVPERVPRADDKSMNIYSSVASRMEPFFKKKNYTNVRALSIISY